MREQIPVDELRLPVASIPMPGDEVRWYEGAAPLDGRLLGYNMEGNPVVINTFENPSHLPHVGRLRLLNPFEPIGPNWRRLAASGRLWRLTDEETTAFRELLGRRTAPGPRYHDLIEELWSRGFETYVVGGTVRDVVSGIPSHDVDLATTMPLNLAVPLLQSMYGEHAKPYVKRGFIRLGGRPGDGDAFIDLKTFVNAQSGTAAALFGADFTRDVAHRDFTANSLYYCPMNDAIVDPTGLGLSDAIDRRLRIVYDHSSRDPHEISRVTIRFFKFTGRGFGYCGETLAVLTREFVPYLSTIRTPDRVAYVRTQLLGKEPQNRHEEIIDRLEQDMCSCGFAVQWETLFKPVRSWMISGEALS